MPLSPTMALFVYLPAERVRDAELRWLDGHGTFTPVPGGRAPFVSIALSPDGREVAGNLVEGQKQQVWIFDLARGARRLLIADEDSYRVIWSRDGKFITYFGRRNGAQGLYRTRADGTGVEEFLVRAEGQYPWPEDWSPDGQSLLFSQYTDRGDSDVWIYARGKATPLMTSPFNEAGATFSPDGRFIAFEADDGGVGHVYVQAFPGPGARAAVSVDESNFPRWAADGQRLFFWSNRRIMAVTVQTNPVMRIGQPELLVDPGQALSGDFSVAPDGRRFLTVSNRMVESPLELKIVLNWFEELERLAPHPR
jgi:Tol biopolymer transport system component